MTCQEAEETARREAAAAKAKQACLQHEHTAFASCVEMSQKQGTEGERSNKAQEMLTKGLVRLRLREACSAENLFD